MSVDLKTRIEQLTSLAEAEQLYPPRKLPEGAEVVRVAPSPTGMPHIGTAMQAVIDRSLADKTNGVFILRIEDTDQARSVPGAIEAITAGLRWLGTTPDEGLGFGGDYGPYLQSERLKLYQLAAEHLIEKGHAYRCFCTPERLEKLREEQSKAKMMPKYDRLCSRLSAEEVAQRIAKGEKSVVRMRVPKDGTKILFKDEVRGAIEFDTKVLDDSVLLKGDGFPTYHLAVIVDDHFMHVTTVVRGEEWISSAPKHVLLYRMFGWKEPKWLHTVLLRDAERRKLSKRSGDTSITGYRVQGYLPDGLRNFLTRVMWAHPENKDIYDLAEFARLVSPSALPSTGPIADMKLFGFINGSYLARYKGSELRALFVQYLDYLVSVDRVPEWDEDEHGPALTIDLVKKLKAEIEGNTEYADHVFGLEPERHQKLSDVFRNCGFLFETLFVPASAELLAKHCPEADKTRAILTAVLETAVGHAESTAWDPAMRKIAADQGVKDKVVFMLSRVAITGQEKTPPLFEIMHMLGDDRVKRRLQGAISRAGTNSAAA